MPADAKLTPAAERRLEVMQSLDTLGAGFQLASHDLDIRGAGNLLGEEQSGHIREVGYRALPADAGGGGRRAQGRRRGRVEDQWTPQITLGTAGAHPGGHTSPICSVRLGLYRRLRTLDSRDASSTPLPPS